MATLQQIERALHNAHNAGDEDAARHLASVYKSMQSAEQPQTTQWSDVPGQAISNIPSSAGRFLKGVGEAVTNPIDTTQGLLNVAQGGIQNVLPDSVNQSLANVIPGYDLKNAETAGAVGQFYKERYGSEEGFKQAIANDPVGVLADISVVSGGAGGLAKVAGLGKTAQAANAVSKATNPMTIVGTGIKAAGKAAKATGKGAATVIGGIGTHTGGESLKRAAGAGFEGGNKLKALTENMRGLKDQADIVPQLKSSLADMRKQNYAKYQQGMTGVHSDPAILNFSKVEDAVSNALNEGIYKGRTGTSGQSINVNAASNQVKKQISALVDRFKKAPPEEFHNPGGFDELKRGIGNIMDGYDYNTPQYRVAKQVYDAVKGEITKQAPEYARVMADSQKGIELTKEIERSLKLGNKASADTALRSLQSVMRNNANSNFGSRVNSVNLLDEAGGNAMEALAGQSLNTWTPRGIGGALQGSTAALAAYLHSPMLASTLVLQSPRLMGEAAILTGKTAKQLSNMGQNKLAQLLARSAPSASVAGNINRKKQ